MLSGQTDNKNKINFDPSIDEVALIYGNYIPNTLVAAPVKPQPPEPTKVIPIIPKGLPRNSLFAPENRYVDISIFMDKQKALPEGDPTCHVVEEVQKNNYKWYFKHVRKGSELLAPLEAAVWSWYHLIAPELVPENAHAYYDSSGQYVGLGVKAIANWRSFDKDEFNETDLANNECVSNLGISQMMSFIFEEDDYTRRNGTKKGQRIDMDMSVRPVLGFFKKGTFFDGVYRPYSTEMFLPTAYDIENFPDIKNAKPFYWATTSNPYVPTAPLRTLVGKMTSPDKSSTVNDFSQRNNDDFKKLATNPTYIYSKFRTLLKFILLDTSNFMFLAKQHIRNDLPHPDPRYKNKKITEVLTDHIDLRKRQFREVLVRMDSFHTFLLDYGQQAKKEIMQEIAMQNDKAVAHWLKHDGENVENLAESLIHTDNIERNFDEVFAEMMKYFNPAEPAVSQRL